MADQVLHGRHQLREQRGANLILARKRSELFIDALRVQDFAIEKPADWVFKSGEQLQENFGEVIRDEDLLEAIRKRKDPLVTITKEDPSGDAVFPTVQVKVRPVEPEKVDELAFHFSNGGDDTKALPYLEQAGERAKRLLAYQEALTYFESAITILERTSTIQDRDRRRMQLMMCAGEMNQALGQWDKLLENFRRALDLSEKIDDEKMVGKALMQIGGSSFAPTSTPKKTPPAHWITGPVWQFCWVWQNY